MSEQGFIEPDLDFITSLKEAGGDSLKKCYQCATCTVVCNVTPQDKPFPRKEMIWAQWGLKDKLMYNPDIWLCHQCGDCSTYCPRGAKPMDVMSAVRNMSFREFAVPSFLGGWLANPGCLLPLFTIPIAILFLALMAWHSGISIPTGEIEYAKFFPIKLIDTIFIPVALFVTVTSLLSIRNFWMGLKKHNNVEGGLNIVGGIIGAVTDILTHKRFRECDTNASRYTSHLLTFFGFLALFATTNLVMVLLYGLGIHTPLPLDNPVKLLGNAGAIAAFIGVTIIVINRLTNEEKTGKSSYYDWTFILVLYLTVITGILSELTRLAEMPGAAYPVYFVHLVFVFFLIAYLPFSKFAHMIYRATAMVFANAIDRKKNESAPTL
ncbi:MAG: quinone-interacting membrane-bound oxidoreductase complex subunit QmoC [Nitrospinota bacterium]